MAEKTVIAWTHHTFNIAWGCAKVSPGCKNCYADTLSARYGHSVWGPGNPRRTFGEKHWAEPYRWDREAKKAGERRRVFACSMCDYMEDHPTIAAEREKLWPLILDTPNLDWLLLTKRADRIADDLPGDWCQGYPNVWLGVSVENEDYLWRADRLTRIPAAVRFVSYEPALGPLGGLKPYLYPTYDRHWPVNWVIYGGESGKGYRPEDKQWARDVRDACRAAGAAFFHKQSAAYRTEVGIELDGEIVREYPTPPRAPFEVV